MQTRRRLPPPAPPRLELIRNLWDPLCLILAGRVPRTPRSLFNAPLSSLVLADPALGLAPGELPTDTEAQPEGSVPKHFW